ncbi:MAG: class I SAM-dependent methyltransferase [Phycisphaerae bacterium]|jgi:SAM-dependent methyltransferase
MKVINLLKIKKNNTRGIDDPLTTLLHFKIIQNKKFLKKIYIDFYKQFLYAIDNPISKTLVELGSGGGFIKEIIPNVITSDVIKVPGVDMVFSAEQMPFENGSVDAFFMFDVLHHIPNPRMFFKEAVRCLKTGGKIVMIEPANTLWGRFIYKNFHHEGFDEKAGWQMESTGPLSCANGAVPWIIFNRDRKIFENEFPDLKILKIAPHTPLRYLISGGLTLRQLLPGFCYSLIAGIEWLLSPANGILGMFQTIEVKKK